MDKYRRVERKVDAGDGTANDKSRVRITPQGNIRKYISYATKILNDEEIGHVELTGLGKTIGKAITVCELLRRQIPTLHQLTKLSTVSITDQYEPLEEGLDAVVTVRTVSCIRIFLTSDGSKIEKGAGYAPPLAAKEETKVEETRVNETVDAEHGESVDQEHKDETPTPPTEDTKTDVKETNGETRRGGGRGRRGRWRGRSRGRGRGRGRGWRGRGRREDANGRQAESERHVESSA